MNFDTIPSPPDSRDYKTKDYLLATPQLPPKFDLRPHLPTIRNQALTNSCTAHAACTIKEYHEQTELGSQSPLYFSPAFLYGLRSNAPDPGMHLRDCLEILRTKGVPPESDYPIILHPFDKSDKPSSDIIKLAKPYRIQRYHFINTIPELKAALHQFGPVLAGFPVYSVNSLGVPRMQFWRKKSETDRLRGGHAVTIVGWDDSYKVGETTGCFIVRNSWGLVWGDHGYTYFPYEDWGKQWEFWAVEDAKSIGMEKPKRCADACMAHCYSCWV